MVILYDFYYPAYKAGGPIQSIHNLAQEMKECDISVICSNRDRDGSRLNVLTDQWACFNGVSVYYNSKGFHGIQKALQQRSGPIIINGIYSLHYCVLPLLFLEMPKIISVRGMLHPWALEQKRLKKIMYLALWKISGVNQICRFHATTEEEKGYIVKALGKNTRVHVAPNFPRIFQKQDVRKKCKGFLQLVSIALISPMKNHLPVLKALEQIGRMHAPGVQILYHIYGPVKEADYWQQCRKLIRLLPAHIQVLYHGEVAPANIEKALDSGHVFILPSKSENFGHAIFEALSAGKPVITSGNTPWNGLEVAQAGLNINPEHPEEITAAILHFAALEQEDFEKWSRGAKAYSGAAMSTQCIREQYQQLFSVENFPGNHCMISLRSRERCVYLTKFFCAFSLLFFSMKAILLLTAAESPYVLSVSGWLNLLQPVQTLLVHGVQLVLSLLQCPTDLQNSYTLKLPGGTGVRLLYSCIGYGIISFWVAFVFANSGSFRKKIWWMAGGGVAFIGINVIRVSMVLVAQRQQWLLPFGFDFLTGLNVLTYLLIFLMLCLYHRASEGSKTHSPA